MSPDRMSVRLHLRRIRVVGVLVDLIEKLVVEIADVRRVVRCPHCGFKTTTVHDRRRYQVHDLPTRGRPTTLMWVRRRLCCGECGERGFEEHPEIILGGRTHVTRRLARQLVNDVSAMSIREVSRTGLPWHYVMGLTLAVVGSDSGGSSRRDPIGNPSGRRVQVGPFGGSAPRSTCKRRNAAMQRAPIAAAPSVRANHAELPPADRASSSHDGRSRQAMCGIHR